MSVFEQVFERIEAETASRDLAREECREIRGGRLDEELAARKLHARHHGTAGETPEPHSGRVIRPDVHLDERHVVTAEPVPHEGTDVAFLCDENRHRSIAHTYCNERV